MAGHDTGMWIGYALAVDYPDRVACLAVAEAAVPGLSGSPPLFGSRAANDRLWHFTFNRLDRRGASHRCRGREHDETGRGRGPQLRFPQMSRLLRPRVVL